MSRHPIDQRLLYLLWIVILPSLTHSQTHTPRQKITSFPPKIIPSPRERMTSFTANICAKETATRATRNMFPERGRQCVCDVFDVAVKDHAPFVATTNARDVAFFRREAGFGGMGSSPPPPPPARRTPAFVEKGRLQQQQQQQSGPSFTPPRWSDR
jgi:hypothetical protein